MFAYAANDTLQPVRVHVEVCMCVSLCIEKSEKSHFRNKSTYSLHQQQQQQFICDDINIVIIIATS